MHLLLVSDTHNTIAQWFSGAWRQWIIWLLSVYFVWRKSFSFYFIFGLWQFILASQNFTLSWKTVWNLILIFIWLSGLWKLIGWFSPIFTFSRDHMINMSPIIFRNFLGKFFSMIIDSSCWSKSFELLTWRYFWHLEIVDMALLISLYSFSQYRIHLSRCQFQRLVTLLEFFKTCKLTSDPYGKLLVIDCIVTLGYHPLRLL